MGKDCVCVCVRASVCVCFFFVLFLIVKLFFYFALYDDSYWLPEINRRPIGVASQAIDNNGQMKRLCNVCKTFVPLHLKQYNIV